MWHISTFRDVAGPAQRIKVVVTWRTGRDRFPCHVHLSHSSAYQVQKTLWDKV
jgi:hypothetical protein